MEEQSGYRCQQEERRRRGGGGGLRRATCGSAECVGLEVDNGAGAICIQEAAGFAGCCRWI